MNKKLGKKCIYPLNIKLRFVTILVSKDIVHMDPDATTFISAPKKLKTIRMVSKREAIHKNLTAPYPVDQRRQINFGAG